MEDENEGDPLRGWKHFVAGGIAGAVSRTLTAPLDRLKVMAQVTGQSFSPITGIKRMLKEGGFRSMWRGNGINILKIAPENAVKFFTYDELKGLIHSYKSNEALTTFDRILAAGLAGTFAHIVIFPLEVLKTRVVMQNTAVVPGLRKTFKAGYKTNGWKFLFNGFAPSLIGVFTFCSIDLNSYEVLKEFFKQKNKEITAAQITLCGFISALLGNIASYPLALVATYLQFSDYPGQTSTSVMRVFINDRYKSYGVIGFYKGCIVASIKTLPSVALTYLVYEHMLKKFNTEMR